jgi:hypothetical protein
MRVAHLLGAGAGAAAPSVPIPTNPPAFVSRRQLLSRVALLGLGAAAGGAVALAADGTTAQPASPPTAGPTTRTTLTMHAQRVRIDAIGQRPGTLPAVDRPFAAHGVLTDANGAALGSFAITPLPSAAGALQLHTFELEGGTLLGMGTEGGEGTFAVIGGTGRYRGTTGSYTARVGADASGRQTSADFQFDLAGE